MKAIRKDNLMLDSAMTKVLAQTRTKKNAVECFLKFAERANSYGQDSTMTKVWTQTRAKKGFECYLKFAEEDTSNSQLNFGDEGAQIRMKKSRECY